LQHPLHEGGPPPVVLVGTTASGKSALAFSVASARPGTEIVSVDSMSVYRGMDVGTAKPTPEQRAAVRHHLIDLLDPAQECTVAHFQAAARAALTDIAERQGRALLVGGTGLYVRAVVDDLSVPPRYPEVAAQLELEADQPGGLLALYERLGTLDPVAATKMTPQNRRRIVRALEVTLGSGRPFSSYGPGLLEYRPTRFRLIGLPFEPERVDATIESRFRGWMDEGLLEEVRWLAKRPGGLSRTARQALGYRELLEHLEGRLSLADAVTLAIQRTRAFARRQWSWFRRDPRITWVARDQDPAEVLGAALEG
jgi:tRNA dimethylallyltransferase